MLYEMNAMSWVENILMSEFYKATTISRSKALLWACSVLPTASDRNQYEEHRTRTCFFTQLGRVGSTSQCKTGQSIKIPTQINGCLSSNDPFIKKSLQPRKIQSGIQNTLCSPSIRYQTYTIFHKFGWPNKNRHEIKWFVRNITETIRILFINCEEPSGEKIL